MTTRRTLANAIRALSMDAVQKANSGHPGAPMGMADIAEVLWSDYLRFNPANPNWADRDRFVMSNGHGSMLLYSVLHLTGYDLPLDELVNFRQLGSRTPGHPEYGLTPGVETTTGPLGQGLANAVGMALAERALAERFNRKRHPVVDHYTYVFAGDGCLMEGISHEACSLAGTLGLGKLICIYDDNGISIDGEVSGWFTDDTPARFRAYGWHVLDDIDGHDPEAVSRALEVARGVSHAPSIICCKTIIGWGSPNKQGREVAHGAPLGDDEVNLVRKTIGWPHPPFEIPQEIRTRWDARKRGAALEADWNEMFERYRKAFPDLAAEFERRMSGQLPSDWQEFADGVIRDSDAAAATLATRKASLAALNGFGPRLPEIIGGSADLTGSNLTYWSASKTITADDPGGNYLYFGVREFAMSAITNGLALHGGYIPYCATFLVFSDYARNAVRLASLMSAPSIFVYTHDSIGLGEDGPTHQPIEHLASLRIMPNLRLWRPCDAVESAIAWRDAIENRSGPSCLVFTRQGVPHQERTDEQLASIRRGGYVLRDADSPDAVIIATGSEVALAMEATERLAEAGRSVRVVSMPCTQQFDAQDAAYRASVLPTGVPRVAVEAGVTEFWWRYVGDSGKIIGVDRYGESAPAKDVYRHLGVATENIVETLTSLI